jgi:hypothetical protein
VDRLDTHGALRGSTRPAPPELRIFVPLRSARPGRRTPILEAEVEPEFPDLHAQLRVQLARDDLADAAVADRLQRLRVVAGGDVARVGRRRVERDAQADPIRGPRDARQGERAG